MTCRFNASLYKFAVVGVFAIFLAFVTGFRIGKDELLRKQDMRKCQAPVLKITSVTLHNARGRKGKRFPQRYYTKALKKYPDKKQLKQFLSQEAKRLKESIKFESPIDSYPACLYKEMCKTTRKVVTRLPVINSNFKCWSIQPVIWTTCNPRLIEDLSCVDSNVTRDFGYTCLAEYARQSLWVYCQIRTKDGDPIRVMPVYIPFKCSVYTYCCRQDEA